MNAKELATLLTGHEYPFRLSKDEVAQAKAAGLVVVYGASDDLMEFEGAFCDEIGCYGGGKAFLTPYGLLANDCENEECPYFLKLEKLATTIEARWCAEGDYIWTYKTVIPHDTFEIVYDGGPYCRGIVFSLSDVAASKREE